MNTEAMKQFWNENKKGIIVGAIGGFLLRMILFR